ncbi:hypothetical protein HYZ64_02650 [Candidatus Berkelbacteria bacterium]|nr:hypothetical protein [Candidatus Berkelbacteria bacterium]
MSHHVLKEARGNIRKNLPRALASFERIIKAVKPRIVQAPSEKAITRVAEIIDAKDAPILAAAITAKVDYLVTLDQRHFKTVTVKQNAPFPVLIPAELTTLLRGTLE